MLKRWNRISCVALVLAAFSLAQVVRAETAANAFVVVEAEGVRIGDGDVIHFANATSATPVRVTARTGWRVNGRKEISTTSSVDVCELSIDRPDFIGLDRTDAGRANPTIYSAAVHLDPEPSAAITYDWRDCGICSFTGRTDQARVRYFAPDPDRASASFLAEPLTVAVGIGDSVSATCTTNFTVFGVSIFLGETDVSGETYDTWAGSRVRLTARIVPRDLGVTSYSWNVPGVVIGGWHASDEMAFLLPFHDSRSSEVLYYWVDGGNERTVGLSAHIGNECALSEMFFNVNRPVVGLSVKSGCVDVSSAWGSLELHCGTPQSPGCSFMAYPQNRGTGSFQWVQLVETVRRKKLNGGRCLILSGSGLDSKYPYAEGLTTTDSPGTGLESDVSEKSVNDSFRMFFMFRPQGSDSTWIPLKCVIWGWRGKAKRKEGGWTLIEAIGPDAEVTDTVNHPVWTNKLRTIWVDETSTDERK